MLEAEEAVAEDDGIGRGSRRHPAAAGAEPWLTRARRKRHSGQRVDQRDRIGSGAVITGGSTLLEGMPGSMVELEILSPTMGMRTVALRREPVDITLIDRRNFHLFQPLLYQVATGGLSGLIGPLSIAIFIANAAACCKTWLRTIARTAACGAMATSGRCSRSNCALRSGVARSFSESARDHRTSDRACAPATTSRTASAVHLSSTNRCRKQLMAR